MLTLNFVVEIAIPFVIGFVVSFYLKDVTAHLLVDLCGTEDRSKFWTRITSLSMIAVPLLFVLMFPLNKVQSLTIGEVIRHTMTMTMAGIVVSVILMALVILRSIRCTGQNRTMGGGQ